MKINKQNYVDEAERVIIGLKEADRIGPYDFKNPKYSFHGVGAVYGCTAQP